MRNVINDHRVEVVAERRNTRPGAAPSSIDAEALRASEAASRKIYNVPTVPQTSSVATDMPFLRDKGVQCYGIGPMVDEEDAPKGFGAHSDQERIVEAALYQFIQFNWNVTLALAAKR